MNKLGFLEEFLLDHFGGNNTCKVRHCSMEVLTINPDYDDVEIIRVRKEVREKFYNPARVAEQRKKREQNAGKKRNAKSKDDSSKEKGKQAKTTKKKEPAQKEEPVKKSKPKKQSEETKPQTQSRKGRPSAKAKPNATSKKDNRRETDDEKKNYFQFVARTKKPSRNSLSSLGEEILTQAETRRQTREEDEIVFYQDKKKMLLKHYQDEWFWKWYHKLR